jgi:hypothetical protein
LTNTGSERVSAGAIDPLAVFTFLLILSPSEGVLQQSLQTSTGFSANTRDFFLASNRSLSYCENGSEHFP